MSLVWTKTAPTVPGSYLYAVADTKDLRLYRIDGPYRHRRGLVCIDYPRWKTLRGWWSGPISVPS